MIKTMKINHKEFSFVPKCFKLAVVSKTVNGNYRMALARNEKEVNRWVMQWR